MAGLAVTWEGLSPPYRTLVADPPWPIADPRRRPVIGARGRRRRSTTLGYSLMSLEDIMALPVAELVGDDAHLYLWITAALNREGAGLRVADAWGFRVVGEIVWAKPSFGMGAFPRPQHEILLVCKRGRLNFAPRDVGSVHWWTQPRGFNSTGKIHSAKPLAALDLVERASPPPYLELFCRSPRFGWDSWGYGHEPSAPGKLFQAES